MGGPYYKAILLFGSLYQGSPHLEFIAFTVIGSRDEEPVVGP